MAPVTLADAFGDTSAGYIIGIGLPILAALVAGLFVRYERAQTRTHSRLDSLGTAITANTQALAVLVQQASDDRPTLKSVPDLNTALEVLRERVGRWESEHERLRDAQARVEVAAMAGRMAAGNYATDHEHGHPHRPKPPR